jgi:hypothetical protein
MQRERPPDSSPHRRPDYFRHGHVDAAPSDISKAKRTQVPEIPQVDGKNNKGKAAYLPP